jgi:metal-sulfur cluster biosynthetic enzyme|tara:strand:+ start:2512 stop:2889 length:378 start_codon:yes stop_codon:yes gene_type:complete
MINRDKVVEILKQCYDPEIPIDLWNLGLIYDIEILKSNNDKRSNINITMSLTTPGCAMGQYMANDIKDKLESLNEVNQASVQVTFEPPWTPDMMTAEARDKLGFNPQPPPMAQDEPGGWKQDDTT